MAAYNRGFDLRSGLAAHGRFCKFPAVLFDRPVCIDSEVRSLVCLSVCSFVCNPAGTIEVRTLGWARGICQFGSYIPAVAIAVRRIKSV